ncbi:MAG: hypothetical protein WCV63_07610 [Negativicutes bacterium]|jgi:hypothetical protein
MKARSSLRTALVDKPCHWLKNLFHSEAFKILLGVCFGSLLTFGCSYYILNKQIEVDNHRFLLQQRIQLIEQMASLAAEQQHIKDLWLPYKNNFEKTGAISCNAQQNDVFQKMTDYNARYYSNVILISHFFGKDVAEKLKAMDHAKAWEIKKEEYNALIDAMCSKIDLPE